MIRHCAQAVCFRQLVALHTIAVTLCMADACFCIYNRLLPPSQHQASLFPHMSPLQNAFPEAHRENALCPLYVPRDRLGFFSSAMPKLASSRSGLDSARFKTNPQPMLGEPSRLPEGKNLVGPKRVAIPASACYFALGRSNGP